MFASNMNLLKLFTAGGEIRRNKEVGLRGIRSKYNIFINQDKESQKRLW